MLPPLLSSQNPKFQRLFPLLFPHPSLHPSHLHAHHPINLLIALRLHMRVINPPRIHHGQAHQKSSLHHRPQSCQKLTRPQRHRLRTAQHPLLLPANLNDLVRQVYRIPHHRRGDMLPTTTRMITLTRKETRPPSLMRFGHFLARSARSILPGMSTVTTRIWRRTRPLLRGRK